MEALTRQLIRGEGTTEGDWPASEKFARIPSISAGELVPVESRAIVISPHPDDEILGMGGLMAQLGALGREVVLISISDGTASHPGSTIWPPARLAKTRPAETIRALKRLHLEHIPIIRAGFPDGHLLRYRDELITFIERLLQPGDVVFSTWRFDGHPDHEAVGLASAIAARESKASLVEVPIQAWHWADPAGEEIPWHRARRLRLNAATLARKHHAIQAHKSQLALDPSTELGPVVPASALARLMRPEEIYLV